MPGRGRCDEYALSRWPLRRPGVRPCLRAPGPPIAAGVLVHAPLSPHLSVFPGGPRHLASSSRTPRRIDWLIGRNQVNRFGMPAKLACPCWRKDLADVGGTEGEGAGQT